jgi:hypothetical protein
MQKPRWQGCVRQHQQRQRPEQNSTQPSRLWREMFQPPQAWPNFSSSSLKRSQRRFHRNPPLRQRRPSLFRIDWTQAFKMRLIRFPTF